MDESANRNWNIQSLTPPGKGKKDSKSRVISARLHPSHEKERDALEVFDGLRLQGFDARSIITDALLFAAGRTPEMFQREDRLTETVYQLDHKLEILTSLEEKMDALTEALSSRMGDLLKAIRDTDPDGLRQFANQEVNETEELELSDDFIANARKAARKTFKDT